MPTKYYPKKKRLQKKHVKNIKISLEKNKTKGDKRSVKDIKIFLKKKKKKHQYYHERNKSLSEEQNKG